MRPLRLDIAGFAAFRDATSVDFADADYFALTGPTGSGKSTVIDAMTFALYGSAPRWGRENAIQYALAPTANRCTVRLVFDVAGQRYVAAREVRRSGKSITQRNARLERYLDPAATGDAATDEPTESLAADPRAVRAQVAELLGLDFEDFCTCVVLPQGDFATFLQASVGERQTILLKLLGARHYETIGRLANSRAAQAHARIDALQGQLVGYADATPDAEGAARAREIELQTLHTTVRADVDELTDTLARRVAAGSQVDRVTAEVALLASVRTPADIEDLQRVLAAADESYRTTSELERVAHDALQAAEEALRAGPERAPLEEALRWHTEWADASARSADVAAAAESAAAALTDVSQAAELADGRLEQHRRDHELARGRRDRAVTTLAQQEERVAALRALEPPAGTADLDRAAATARAATAQADQEVDGAEATLAQVTEEIAGLPERSALLGLQRAVEVYATTLVQLGDLQQQVGVLGDDVATAEAEVARALADRNQAHAEVDELRTRSAAADLRPHLQLGRPCPVCDQVVATVPPAIAVPALDSARAALDRAEQAYGAADATADALRVRLTGLTTRTEGVAQRLAELDHTLLLELPDHPAGPTRDPARDRAVVGDLLAALEAAQSSRRIAVEARDAARQALRTAEQDAERIAAAAARSWASLHAGHGQLTLLGAPPVTADGLADAWAALLDWATDSADRLAADDLPAARTALAAAESELAEATQQLQAATSAARAAAEERTAAAVADGNARAAEHALVRRLDQLETLLADRPAEKEARRLLAEHHRLEREAAEARTAAATASRTRLQAEVERDDRHQEREAARTLLRRVREPLLGLGVPVVDDTDLGTAWAELTGWALTQTASHQSDLSGLRADLAYLDRELGERLVALQQRLTAQSLTTEVPTLPGLIESGPARLTRIPTDIELTLERARAATAEIGRRRTEAEKLRSTIATDTETEQVARQLALMMSAKRFPQWLADAALDTLVADASASLLQLSGGQFELTHDKGEFFVIDHADADSARSVKTLSGGETFQASLALALALSEQLSTLAAGGRTTLDSIFLDEGFGTLDPDALEIVASTLENLAQGNRMVGVVTHVAALAERVPVRFEVSRDSRTSTVERVG